MTDAVDRLDAVAGADRVQRAPLRLREHLRVDLEVQVAVRVAGTRRVVADDRRLESPLDRHLDLAVARPGSGRRVLGQPADDLDGGAFLSGVVRSGDLRVQRCGERPGLRAVDDDLDEAQRVSSLLICPFATPVSTS